MYASNGKIIFTEISINEVPLLKYPGLVVAVNSMNFLTPNQKFIEKKLYYYTIFLMKPKSHEMSHIRL